ncbi:MAG: glycoside hydrolase family 9 protein [Oscillospiraceae bacterium]|nr:glycoside hydrolase family 9 protein [Oscillospiraceae bacterium]
MKKNLFKRAASFATAAAVTASAAVSVLSVSPAIEVSAANADTTDYAKALQYSLYFYDANMCGDEVDEHSHVTWRGDCHTYSDVVGGFHDAGDHVMFGMPQGYSAATIGWSYYEYKDVYEELGLTTHFKIISDHFNQYFKDCTTLSNGSVTNFMYEAGEGNTDHSYWDVPEKQTQSQWGRCLWTSNGASNIAAQYAASLAISYMNFGNQEDLTYAKALFDFANKYRSNYSVSFYASSDCVDEVAWAAGWLYLATKDSSYKSIFSSTKPSYVGWTYCWDNMSLGCAILDGYINNNWSTAGSYISEKVNSSQSSYWFLQQWGSARYNAALQFCALVVSKNSSSYDFTSWAKWQMTYLLGGNGAKACFLTGLGDNSAKYPHHRAASGLVGWDGTYGFNNNTTYGPDGHTLIGALVGGPTSADGSYTDSVKDAVANEVAIDYNAGFVGAAAGLYDVYGTGSVVTYINDEIEVCLDTQAAQTYAITASGTNCNINLSATEAEEGATVSFTLSPTISNYNDPTVTVTTASGTTISCNNSNGTYSFTMPASAVTVSAEYTEAATIIWGDANGDGIVNSIDATMVTRHALKVLTLSDEAQACSDVNGDGVINSIDATIITRYALKVITVFPVETA